MLSFSSKKKDDQPPHFGHCTSFVFKREERREKREERGEKREERRENRVEERREDGYWAKHKLQDVGVGLQTAVSGSRGICYMLGVQQQNPRTRHYYSRGMLGVKVARGCNNIFNSVSLFNCLSLSVCFSFYFYFSSACRDRRQTLRLFAGN